MSATTWRIINTGSLDPFSNMAFDEAILRGYEIYNSPPTLRIYGWQPSGISIGYAQDADEVLDLGRCKDESISIVRRITGGGIILHGDELTYSLVSSKEDLGISAHISSSYKIVASFLMEFYKTLGIDADFACDVSSSNELGAPSVLCFAGREKYDIVVRGKKIGGSAQKRLKHVIFQHGSIPLKLQTERATQFLHNSADAELAGIVTCLEELLDRPLDPTILSEMLVDAFKRSFKVDAVRGFLSEQERDIFTQLKEVKYSSDDWNLNRIDKFREKIVCV